MTAAPYAVPMEAGEIRRLLPHRYPMLLVDRVTDLVPARSVTATKAVTGNEPWFAGLPAGPGPGPAYPEALLLESWCQAAGLLAVWHRDSADKEIMLFGGVSDVTLHHPVYPGDVLEHRVRVVRMISDTMIFEGDSRCGDRVVVEVGRATLAMRPAGGLRAGPEPDRRADT